MQIIRCAFSGQGAGGKGDLQIISAGVGVHIDGFPGDMWDGTEFMIFVLGTESNPLTVDTKIRITSGSLTTPTTTPNRIYVDNFYIRRVTEVDEPYFEQNGGSGVDKIMAATEEVE